MSSPEIIQLRKILFVIVIFKRFLKESETYISLQRDLATFNVPNLDLYIYDNSPEPQRIDESDTFNIIYTHDASNPGVSRAYNKACSVADKIGKNWLMILDQDTILPLGSVERYCEALGDVTPGINIIAPMLYSNNILISPCRYFLHRGFILSNAVAGNFPIQHHSFLNSGLLINVRLIEDVGFYDDALFDYSDHDFFLRFSKKNRFVSLMDLRLAHNFSGGVQGSLEDNTIRFKKLAAASRYIAKKYHSAWPIIWLLFRGIKLSLLFKNRFFIFYLLKNKSEHV